MELLEKSNISHRGIAFQKMTNFLALANNDK
jgi:inosine/xanthosine triphosphate pyrophosphatase family protein